MDELNINGHIRSLSVTGGIVNINGHVDDLRMYGGVIHDHGHVDDFHQYGGIQQDRDDVVYRDRVVEKEVVKEVVKWKYRDREKIVYRDNDETAHLRDLLNLAMEVNHEQAERVKELERVISEHREAQAPDPWDVRPTPEECERLLNQFDLFMDV